VGLDNVLLDGFDNHGSNLITRLMCHKAQHSSRGFLNFF
jgi:hypothetical protein